MKYETRQQQSKEAGATLAMTVIDYHMNKKAYDEVTKIIT